MSDSEMEAKGPEPAIMNTPHLLRFPAIEPGNPEDSPEDISSTTPTGQHETTTMCTPLPSSPPAIARRTPMGDYIVPPGERPLTSLGYPAPGPAEYKPKIDLTKKSAPHYSLVGRMRKKEPNIQPGPADYSCGKDLIWKGRTITIKAKADMNYGESVAATDIGPAKYNTVKPIGDSSPSFSMATKHTHIDVMAGPPDDMVQPVDTHGFWTPGPDYRPNSGYWGRGPKKSFGNSRRAVFTVTDNPGPGEYDISEPKRGPSYSLTKRLSNADETIRHKKKNDPAPNAYDVGSTVGNAVAVSIAGRRKEPAESEHRKAPSPNCYTLKASFDPNYKAATMTYRWFETEKPRQPGPCDYNVSQVTFRKSPVFTCRQRCTKSSPKSTSPGPGTYNIRSNFRHNDHPAFSMGSPAPRYTVKGPAPNQYSVEKFQKPGEARAPAFTMGRRLESPERMSKISPGPAAYNLQAIRSRGPKYTMSKRLGSPIKATRNPAPNYYHPPSCQTNRGIRTKPGVKFKSRASPYVYSGFRTNKLADAVSTRNPAPNYYHPPSCQTNRGIRTKPGVKFKSRASPYVYSGFRTNKLADAVC